MNKIFVLLLGMCIFCSFSYGQTGYVLNGLVVDENNETVAGASVILYPLEESAITDEKGSFMIGNLPAGKYQIEVISMGFHKHTDSIEIDGNVNYRANLKPSSLSLQEVVIADHYAENLNKNESLNVEIVNDDYLKHNLGGSLMSSLERLPGITTIDIGSGQSKPVIRGLGFNRVVVVENNIKHEGQQWGSDHGLEIDQYAIQEIEVIKGPASLMYGSDAIGGVIDLNNRKLPADHSFGGTLDLSGKTNNDFLGTSLSLFGRYHWLFADFRATFINYGDYKVPTDSVDIYSYRAALYNNQMRNTAGKEQNLHATFGIIQEKFQSKFYISSVKTENGFFANAHGLEPRNVDTELHDQSDRDILYPYHSVNHFKLVNTSHYQWDLSRLEMNIGYQRNFREEWSAYVNHGYMPATYPDTLSSNPDLELQFDKQVFTGNLKYHHHSGDKTVIYLGLNSEYQDNRIAGRNFIIPAYTQMNLGGYSLVKYDLTDRSLIQAGVRYDFGLIETEEYYDWFPSPVVVNGDTTMQYLQRASDIDRSFSNFSWSVGYNYFPGKWNYKFNAGKSFRMPHAKELAANGVNYHHFSYEVGDAELSPEVSYQLDAGIEYHSLRFAIGVTPFLNYFTNYIYLNPTSEHDRLYGNGNQVFEYTQSKVFRYGSELHAHFELSDAVQLGLIGEYVYSEQLTGEKKGFTLPFSPAPSGIFNVKFRKQQLKFVENAYLSLDYRITAAQNNIVPPEEPTEGYQLINLGLGGDFNFGNQVINVSMQLLNLFNTKYFNHTSYYRLINVPEAGRNVVMNISLPFSGIIKHQ